MSQEFVYEGEALTPGDYRREGYHQPFTTAYNERRSARRRPEADAVLVPPSEIEQDTEPVSPETQNLPDEVKMLLIGAIQADASERYHIHEREGRFETINPNQHLQASFFPAGVVIEPEAGFPNPWSWRMQLVGIGRGDRRHPLSSAALHVAGNRIEYQRDLLTEWYVNGPLGLEQGFTLQEAPIEQDGETELVLELAFQHGWKPELTEDRQSLLFRADDGQVLRYGHLFVKDASERLLPVHLELIPDAEQNIHQVRIHVDDRDAVYPLVVDPLIQQQKTKLTASDGAANDRFGFSVDISGDTVVVGAYQADPSALTNAGAAYIFVRNGTSWSFQQKLTGVSSSESFGISVAIDGNTLVVGAVGGDPPGVFNAGVAYVYTRSGTIWSPQQTLFADDAVAHDGFFGSSVDISGDTIVVGAEAADVAGLTNAGAAYVFIRNGTSWSQQPKLIASDKATGDQFGHAVAIDGNSIIIGAHRKNTLTGAAYVFTLSGTTWSEQQKLVASDGETDDQFGVSIAISGNTLIIGAVFADSDGISKAGVAYVFVRSGTTWSPQQKLTARDKLANNMFGASVAVKGNIAVVGAQSGNAAYVFVRTSTLWSPQAKIIPNDPEAVGFGNACAISDDTVIIGAHPSIIGLESGQGAAYIFTPILPTASPNTGGPYDSLSWVGEVQQDGALALRTGEKVETATDIAVYSMVGALDFTRTYRQKKQADFQFMGLGWQHNHAVTLTKIVGTPNTILIQMPNGGELKLTETAAGSNSYVADGGSDAVVTYNAGTTQYTLIGSDKAQMIFNSSGKLIQRIWPPFGTNAANWLYNYDGNGRLTSVEDKLDSTTLSGRKLTFAYRNNPGQFDDGQLWRIGDQDTTNLSGSGGGGSFPTSSIKDDFNRANSSSLGANWGTYWGTSNLGINNNECRNPAADGTAEWRTNYYNAAQYGPDCEAFITLKNRPTSHFIIGVRVGGTLATPNNYGLECNVSSGVHRLVRTDNGTETQLGATFNQTLAVGDSIGISAVGSTISAYYKPSGGSWTLLASRTDSTYSSAGYLALESEIGGWRCDDFSGGTVVAGSSPTGRYVEFGYTPQKSNGVAITNAKALLNTVRDARGNTWTYKYFGQAVGETDGNKLHFMTEILSPSVDTTGDGAVDGSLTLESLAYQTSGAIITNITRNVGNSAISTDYAFQPSGQNITTETVAGKTGTHYFNNGVYGGFADPAGNVDTQGINFQYRPEVVQDANAQKTQMGWSADGKFLQTVIDALGQTTTYSYNVSGASADTLNFVQDAEGRKTQYTYGDSANPLLPTAIQVLDTNGTTVLRWQTFTYDSKGRMLSAKLVDPANVNSIQQQVDRAYSATPGNGYGLLLTETVKSPGTPADDSSTTFTYDSKGRVIKTQKTSMFGCCQFTYTVYDDADLVVAMVNSSENITPPASKAAAVALYDAANPDKYRVTTFDYDTMGRKVLTTVFDGAGYAVKELVAYDALGRVIRTIANYVASGSIAHPYTAARASFAHGTNVDQNLVTDSFYNSRGMLRKQIDPLDNVTLYGYDDAGRLVKTVQSAFNGTYNNDYTGVSPDPSLASYSPNAAVDKDLVTTRAYDKAGNLVKTVDAAGLMTYMVYDVLNRVVKTVRAAKDAATVSLNVGDGGYVAANDPRSASYVPDTAVDRDLIETSEYDKMGRVIRTQRLLENRPTAEWETTLYGYDGLGRSVKVVRVANTPAYNIAADPTLASYSASANADVDIVTRTAYDKAERVMYTEDTFGSKTWVGYDGLGRQVKTVVNAVGSSTDGSATDPRSTTYSPNIAADKDLVLSTAYNSDGRVLSTTDALGRVTRYVYDTVGRVTRTVQNFVDQGEPPEQWVYNSGWKKANGTTAINHGADNDQNIVSHTVYDGKGRAVQRIDHRNNVTLTVFDSLDRPIKTVVNYSIISGIDAANAVWDTTDNRWEDGSNNAISFGTDKDQNRITTITYDLLGRQLRMRGADGIETRFTVDALGRRTQAIANYVDGVYSAATPDEDLITTTVFARIGQVNSVTDARGTQTVFDRDKLYRAQRVTRAAGTALASVAFTAFDKAGRVLRTVQNWSNPAGQSWPDVKDGSGNWSWIPSSNGSNNDLDVTVNSLYDKASRPLKRIVNYRTQGASNPANWLWSITNNRWEDGAGAAISHGTNTDQNLLALTSYYKDGQVESMTDADGVVSKHRYDLLRRKTRIVQGFVDQTEDPALWIWDATDTRWEKSTGNVAIAHGSNNDQNIIQLMTYDKGSRMLTQQEPRGNVTTYAYDGLNRRKSLLNPISKQWSTAYSDLVGAGTRQVMTYPGITGFANYTVQQDFDRLGRPLSIQYGAPAVTPDVKLTYDNAGNRSLMSEYSAANFTSRIRETTFSFDKLHRLSSAGFDNDGSGSVDETVSYQYDAGGLRTRLTMPGPSAPLNINYSYDARGRLISLTDWDNQATQMAYDLADRHLTSDRANLMKTQLQYDSAGRLRLLKHTKTGSGGGGSFPTTALKDDFNRANSASLGANWGTFWGNPNLDVNGNACRNPAADGTSSWASNYYSAAQYGPDCEAFITLKNRPTSLFYLSARVGGTLSTPNYYAVAWNAGGSGVHMIVRSDNGSETQLGATFSQALAVDASIGISVVGSTISAYYKPSGGSWTLLTTRSDSTYTAAGYLGLDTEIGGWKGDDFSGGTVVTGSGAGSTQAHFEYKVDRRGNRIEALEALANPATTNDTTFAYNDKGLLLLPNAAAWPEVSGFKESTNTSAILSLKFLASTGTLTLGKGPDHSICELYLNGSLWQTFDGYNATATQVDLPLPGTLVGEGPHLLEIRNKNDKHGSSSGYKVRFKQLVVADKTWNLHTVEYTYDRLARVLEARYNPGINTAAVDADLLRRYLYTYDRAHNRLTESLALNGAAPTVKTLTYNAANQISSSGYTYDNNGNLTSDGVNSYAWDRANRLLSMGTTSYKYEGGGNRIQQTVSGTVSKYLLDLNSRLPTVLAETVGANVTRFLHGPRGLHQLKTAAGVWEHVLSDALGSVRVVTDNAAAVLESRNYGTYGDLFGQLGPSQTNYGYTGEPTDSNGLVYDRARYMSPALGQFISLDPLEVFNRYAYVNGNPVMSTDPSGMVAGFGAGGGVGSVAARPPTTTTITAKPATVNAFALVGSVIGTVVGAVLGGSAGAAIGRVVGAAVGAVVANVAANAAVQQLAVGNSSKPTSPASGAGSQIDPGSEAGGATATPVTPTTPTSLEGVCDQNCNKLFPGTSGVFRFAWQVCKTSCIASKPQIPLDANAQNLWDQNLALLEANTSTVTKVYGTYVPGMGFVVQRYTTPSGQDVVNAYRLYGVKVVYGNVEGAAGQYFYQSNTVVLPYGADPNAGGLKVIMHELIHAYTRNTCPQVLGSSSIQNEVIAYTADDAVGSYDFVPFTKVNPFSGKELEVASANLPDLFPGATSDQVLNAYGGMAPYVSANPAEYMSCGLPAFIP